MGFKEELLQQLPPNGGILDQFGVKHNQGLHLDLPTQKHEEWKYSSVLHLNKSSFTLVNGGQTRTAPPPTGLESLKATVVHLCNGILAGVDGLAQAGVSIQPLSAADPELIRSHLGKYVAADKDIFTGFNAAGANDGICIHVRAGAAVEYPIILLNQVVSGHTDIFSLSRVLVIAEEQAQVSLISRNIHQVSSDSFLNAVTEVYVAPGANVSYVLLQNDPNARHVLENISFHQETGSVVTTCNVLTEGAWTRNDLSFFSNGTATETNMYGLYFLKGNMHADNRTRMDHATPGCTSNELYKGILTDKASGAFNGKIKVWKDAQKTAAYQSNKNILLSETARMNTKPQLEIFADDVKCSHGATVGTLNEESLFYLRSRGIGEVHARHMLTYAFASEVIQKIPNAELVRILEAELAGHMLGDNSL